jgi:hypothetical protein
MRFLCFLAGALLLAGSGCASLQASRARAKALEAQLEAFRYEKPLDEVWQEARRLLAERGYPLASDDAAAVGQKEMSLPERIFSPAKETRRRSADVGLFQRLGGAGGGSGTLGPDDERFLETGWRREGDRYRADGLRDEKGSHVLFRHILQDRTDHRDSAERDPEMELELARRLDPEAAERIEAAVAAATAAR